MTSPIDYSIDVRTPFESALQGYQGGAAIRDDQAAQQQRIAQAEAQKRQNDVIRNLISNPSASAADYSNAVLLVPGMKDQLKQAWDTKNEAQRASSLSDLSQWSAALANGKPEIAVDAMRARADAMETSAGGPTKESQALRTQADVIKAHPGFGLFSLNSLLVAHPDGGKLVDSIAKLGTEQRAAALAPAERAKAEAEAKIKGVEAQYAAPKAEADLAEKRDAISHRAKQLGLEEDKLRSEMDWRIYELRQKQGELPEFVQKGIETATMDSISAQQQSAKLTDMADQFDKFKDQIGEGWKGTIDEAVKAGFLQKNEISRLRDNYSQLATQASMSAYRKLASGSTSDKDITTAMKGWPKDTDPPEAISAYLRGVAKLQNVDAALENAKAEWLGENKHLGKAKKDIDVDGVKVPSGTTFKVFQDKYVERKVAEMEAAQKQKKAAAVVPSRGYMRYATPQPAVSAPVAPANAPGAWSPETVLPLTGGM